MTLALTVRALVRSLVAEGALVSRPAPWGDRVYIQTASQVVELSGARAGNPVSMTWPCLILTGPKLTEDKARRQGHARERLSEDRDAGTMSVREWPRFYDLALNVSYQTRTGFTGSGGSAETLLESELRGIEAFERWVIRTPKLVTTGTGTGEAQSLNLFSTQALGDGGARPTPADIREARGAIMVQGLMVYGADAVTVATAGSIVVGVGLDD